MIWDYVSQYGTAAPCGSSLHSISRKPGMKTRERCPAQAEISLVRKEDGESRPCRRDLRAASLEL